MTSDAYEDIGPHTLALSGPGGESAAALLARDEATEAVDRHRDEYRICSRRAQVLKRTLDIVAVGPLVLLLLVASPLLALLIVVDSRGPVFFKQMRVGRNGQEFLLYKFRTMHRDAELRLAGDTVLYESYVQNGYKLAARTDPRITRVGRWMRKLSIDELPQVVNVLMGHMTLVGPRPVLRSEVAHLYHESCDAYYACRPGLTGPWQVSGRSDIVHAERAELDLEYARSWTLRRDVVILLRTIPAVLSTRGAH